MNRRGKERTVTSFLLEPKRTVYLLFFFRRPINGNLVSHNTISQTPSNQNNNQNILSL